MSDFDLVKLLHFSISCVYESVLPPYGIEIVLKCDAPR
jgi:hypothetical protein